MASRSFAITLTANVDNFERGLDKAGKKAKSFFDGLQKDTERLFKGQQLGGAFKEIGEKATAALTVPIAAGLGVAVKLAGDFDSAMTKSASIMGKLSDQQRARMETNARQVSKTLNIAATDTAKSYYYLASAGLNAEQSIQALRPAAEFAKAGMFDMARATELLMDSQSALGLRMKDATENTRQMARVSDVLVQAANASNASVEQFAASLANKAGAAMRTFNVEVEQGVAVLAAYADQGVKGETAGERFDILLRELTHRAHENAAAFKKMGVDVFDSQGKLSHLASIVGQLEVRLGGMSAKQKVAALDMLGFEARSQSAILALLGLSGQIRTYEDGLKKAGGATKEIAEKQMKAFNEQVGLLVRDVQGLGIEIGQKLLPAVQGGVKWFRSIVPEVESAVKWFTALPGPVQTSAFALTALAAASGPVLFTLGMSAQGVASLHKAWTVLMGTNVAAWFVALGNTVPVLTARIWLLQAGIVSLGAAIKVAGVAAAAYFGTKFLMDVTGARAALDDLIDGWVGLTEAEREAAAHNKKILEDRARIGSLVDPRTGNRGTFKPGSLTSLASGRVVGGRVRGGVAPSPAYDAFSSPLSEEDQKTFDKLIAKLSGAEAQKEMDLLERAIGAVGGTSRLTTHQLDDLIAKVRQLTTEGARARGALAGLGSMGTYYGGTPGYGSRLLAPEGGVRHQPWMEQIDFLGEYDRAGRETMGRFEPAGGRRIGSSLLGPPGGGETKAAFSFGGGNWSRYLQDLANTLDALGLKASGASKALVLTVSALAAIQGLPRIFGKGGKGWKNLSNDQKVQAGVAGIGVLSNAYASGSVGGGAMSGAATGFSMAGPWGAVIGGVAGGVAGYLGKKNNQRKELAVIRAELTQTYGSMDQVRKIGDALGVSMDRAFSTKSPKEAKAIVEQLTKALEKARGELSNWERGVVSASARGLVTARPEDQDVKAFVEQQRALAVGGLQSAVGTTKDGKVTGGIAMVTPEDARAQAAIASVVFWDTFKTEGLLKAAEAFQPIMASLQASLAKIGGDEAAAAILGPMQTLVDLGTTNEAFRGAAEGAQGLGSTLDSLANRSIPLTATQFAAFEQQAQSAYDQAAAAAVESGMTQQQAQSAAIMATAPLLQSLVQSSQAYGMTLGSNTTAMLAMADASGIAFKTDSTDRLIQSINALTTALGGVPPTFESVSASAASASATTASSTEAMASSATQSFGTVAAEAQTMVGSLTDTLGQMPGIAEDAVSDVSAWLDRLPAGIEIPIDFPLNLPDLSSLNPTQTTYEGDNFTSARGFGPRKLGRDTLFQAHEGEHVMILPKGKKVAFKSALQGYYDDFIDYGGGGGGGDSYDPGGDIPGEGPGAGEGAGADVFAPESAFDELTATQQQLIEEIGALTSAVESLAESGSAAPAVFESNVELKVEKLSANRPDEVAELQGELARSVRLGIGPLFRAFEARYGSRLTGRR